MTRTFNNERLDEFSDILQSMYQLAVNLGYEGSFNDWLDEYKD